MCLSTKRVRKRLVSSTEQTTAQQYKKTGQHSYGAQVLPVMFTWCSKEIEDGAMPRLLKEVRDKPPVPQSR